MKYSLKDLIREKDFQFFEISFNPETKVLKTSSSISFGMIARGIGETLSRANISEQEFDKFLLMVVQNFHNKEKPKEQNE